MGGLGGLPAGLAAERQGGAWRLLDLAFCNGFLSWNVCIVCDATAAADTVSWTLLFVQAVCTNPAITWIDSASLAKPPGAASCVCFARRDAWMDTRSFALSCTTCRRTICARAVVVVACSAPCALPHARRWRWHPPWCMLLPGPHVPARTRICPALAAAAALPASLLHT